MSKTTFDEDEVRREHDLEVRPGIQWAYLLGVLAGGTILMLALSVVSVWV